MSNENTQVENLPTLVYYHEYINGNGFVSCSPRVSFTTEQVSSVAVVSYDRVKGWQLKELPNEQKEI